MMYGHGTYSYHGLWVSIEPFTQKYFNFPVLLEFASLVRHIRLFTYLLISLVLIDNLHCKRIQSGRRELQKETSESSSSNEIKDTIRMEMQIKLH